MRRLFWSIVALGLAAASTGCCASPYRFWQNAYGFNDPVPDYYNPGPPVPVTTPPGPTTPAAVPENSAITGK